MRKITYQYEVNRKNIIDLDKGHKKSIKENNILLVIHPLNKYGGTRNCSKNAKKICELHKEKNIPIVFMLEDKIEGNIEFNPDYIIKSRSRYRKRNVLDKIYPNTQDIGSCIKAKEISVIGGGFEECLISVVESLVRKTKKDRTFTFYAPAIFQHENTLLHHSNFNKNPPSSDLVKLLHTSIGLHNLIISYSVNAGVSYKIDINDVNIVNHYSAYSNNTITFNIKSTF